MSTWLIVVLVILGILVLPIALPLILILLILFPVIAFAIVIEVLFLPISLIKAIIVRIAGNDKTITIQTKEISCDKETEEKQ